MTGDFQVNTATLVGADLRPDVGMNAAGDFVVVWDDTIGLFSTAMGRRYDSAGAPARRRVPDQRHEPRGLRPEGRVRFRRKFRRDVEQRARARRRGRRDAATTAPSGRGSYDIGGAPVSEEFVVNEITTGFQCRGAPVARPRRLVRRRLQQRNGLRLRRERPQERSPGGAGDHGRPAPRSGLRTDGRQ